MSGKDQESYWAVSLIGGGPDLVRVADALNGDQTQLEHVDSEWRLTSNRFESCKEAGGVRAEAAALLDVVNGACAVIDRGFEPVTLGNVLRVHPDGRKDAFVYAQATLRLRASVHAVVVSADGTVVEPPPSLAAIATELSGDDDDLERALSIFAEHPRTFASLYKVFELTEEHPDHGQWSSKAQRRRFSHSANSPGASGDTARHATESTIPPRDPMTVAEAEMFVAGILRQWIETAGGRGD